MMEDKTRNMTKPEYIYLEKTLALIKPDAVGQEEQIVDIILNNGFVIAHRRKVHLTPEQASEVYSDHYGKMFFPSQVAYMSSAPCIALLLIKNNAISAWNELIGPTNPILARDSHPSSIRACYGIDSTKNAVHGSTDHDAASKEIKYFFPQNVPEPVLTKAEAESYLSHTVNPTLFKGLTELSKVKPNDPAVWLADWLIDNNPNQPVLQGQVTP